MKLLAVGQSPVGVIAIGQVPIGVIAIGQGARGVIAIGQLACGVIAVGQLAIGVVAFGQLALGAGWAGGMLSVAAVRGPSLIGFGSLGELRLGDLYRLKWNRFRAARTSGLRWAFTGVVAVTTVVVVWLGALGPMIDRLQHDDDPAEIEGPPVLR